MENDRHNIAVTKVRAASTSDLKDGRSVEDSSFALLRDNVTEVLRIVLLRRWSFFVPFCLVTSLAALASLRVTKTFESSTVIERRDHPVLISLHQTAVTGSFTKIFRPALARDVVHPEALAEVVDHLGLAGKKPVGDEKAMAEYRRQTMKKGASLAAGVDVRLTQKDEHFDQIKISYSSSNRSLPQKVVREIKDVYIHRTRATLTAMLSEVADYFTRIADGQRDKIAQLEQDLLTFQAEHIGVDPTDPNALQMKLAALNTERNEMQRDIESLQREITGRKGLLRETKARLEIEASSQVASGMATVADPSSPEVRSIQREINTLEAEIRDLQESRRMTELHPEIVDRRQRIARLQARLTEQSAQDADAPKKTVHSNSPIDQFDQPQQIVLEAPIRAIEMEIKDREAQIELAQRRIDVIDEQIDDNDRLMGNVFAHRKEYMFKKDQIDRARAEYNGSMETVAKVKSVLNADESERGFIFTETMAPTPCIRPVKPRSGTVVALSLLAGVAAGAISVLLKELFDQRFRTTRQVTQSLGLAILESVDEIVTSADRARRFRQNAVFSPLAAIALLGCLGITCAGAYLNFEDPIGYERLMRVPRSWLHHFSNTPAQAAAIDGNESDDGTPATMDQALVQSDGTVDQPLENRQAPARDDTF